MNMRYAFVSCFLSMSLIAMESSMQDNTALLHSAVSEWNFKKIGKLLKLGADPYQKNGIKDQTAISLAQEFLCAAHGWNARQKLLTEEITVAVFRSFELLSKGMEKAVTLFKNARPRLAGKMYLALTEGPFQFHPDVAKIFVKLRYDYKQEKIAS